MNRATLRELRKEYETDFELGQDNIEILGLDIHNPVFFVSALLILTFIGSTLLFPEQANTLLTDTKNWCITHFDWLFMAGGNIFVLFGLALIILPVGKIKLGGEQAKPEFSTLSWLAMLFAAGMGIGLMFWSVSEPLAYYTNWYGTPLNVTANTVAAEKMAMGATMYHWGIHPWAIYGIVALSLAFFTYSKGLPLTIRSTFYPLLGEKIWGWPGHLIDTLAVLATIFGLATSLGLGAKQAASGFNFLFDISAGLNTQIAIITGVTMVAVISVVRGLDGGVKVLSNTNMLLALLLLLFVLLAGPTLELFGWMVTTTGSYIENIVPLSNWVDRADQEWLHGWTVFYWAWWISWSPFVGMFIARISKGRTIREFMIAVLLVPMIITIIWMGTFGGSAIQQAKDNIGELGAGISSVSLTLFQMLEQLPFAHLTSFLAIVLILVFFVTSSDSGSLVIDSITSGGKIDAPVPQRIFWAILEGLIAITLLWGGGKAALSALQAGAISTGLPFTIILLLMCVSLYKGLKHELSVNKVKKEIKIKEQA
ncbi:BCCT family transporter [Catenovulum sediminis]|uniref:BCCT family transporter n=1 Tax=Catenovulum sediminis TaxID=1740262 RepID=A0ABV1RMQ2_9ALTE|nr:BCCT family transporter [Catenovulum sediminis]